MKVFEEWLMEKSADPLGDAIRDALKKAGYKRSQVSVSKGRGGYEIVYHVTVKDLMIPIEKIEKVVKKFQSVDWDERTGEILAGGNTMIFVEYDWKTVSAEEKRLEELKAKCEKKGLNFAEEEAKYQAKLAEKKAKAAAREAKRNKKS